MRSARKEEKCMKGIGIWKEIGRGRGVPAALPAKRLLSFSFDTGLFLVYAWA